MKGLHTLILEVFSISKAGDAATLPRKAMCLASLPKLKTIKIPLQMLVEENSTTDWMMNGSLARVLPRSLKRLIFTVEVRCFPHWYDDDTMHSLSPTCSPSSTVIGFTEAVSRHRHKAFPNLQEMVLCYSMKGYKGWPEFERVEFLGTDLEETDLFGLDDCTSASELPKRCKGTHFGW